MSARGRRRRGIALDMGCSPGKEECFPPPEVELRVERTPARTPGPLDREGHSMPIPSARGWPIMVSDPRRLFATLRQARGTSQKALALQAGLSRSLVAQVEGGTRHPSRAALGRLAQALELDKAARRRLQIAFGYMPDGSLVEQIKALLEADPRLASTHIRVIIAEVEALLSQ